MAEKRVINKFLGIIVVVVIVLFLLVMCSKGDDKYEPIDQLPGYDENSKAKDGDTQSDTIKALQAYAKEAVGKANTLNEETKKHATQVLDNKKHVERLQNENAVNKEALEKTTKYTQELEKHLKAMEYELSKVKEKQDRSKQKYTADGIPIGFGFDALEKKRKKSDGKWHNPIDLVVEEDEQGNRFSGLLSRPKQVAQSSSGNQSQPQEKPKEKINPVYTLPKDATLTDGVAMTALIGRIPVDGTTPDPYPVKIFIGKENLTANGHELPEVEGMVFSGLGFGDWNLSCVNARLYSATYIFSDGTIVNHSDPSIPLGYISDPSGVPCVSGKFVSNAVQFLSQRVGLAGLGTAGAAYAAAQEESTTSQLTGTTTSSITGSIDKLVGGTVVKSATDEVSQWLLERQQQSFDAVVVNPGVAVSVHLEKTLEIDHKEFGRRLRYENQERNYENKLD